MNCMAVECDGRIAVVDCGIMFPNEPVGVDVIAPDLSCLRERREQVGAVFLTHGHEDHLGALPFLLRDVPVPVYGTPLHARAAPAAPRGGGRRGRPARGARRATCARPGDALARSRPSSSRSPTPSRTPAASRSRTPQGTILHSGDFKIDPRPVAGPGHGPRARRGARAARACGSSSPTRPTPSGPGTSLSESEVGAALEEAFERARGRVFVACFASNVHRIQQIANAARAFGRRLALLGRSMEANVRLAQALGLPRPARLDAGRRPRRRASLPPRELCVLTTGTQGEPRSALARLARGEHPDLAVAPGDLVVLSSRFIPGNEVAVGTGGERARAGAAPRSPTRGSGRSTSPATRRRRSSGGSSRLARPAHFVPIHGEYRHLARHAAHAAAEGRPGARRARRRAGARALRRGRPACSRSRSRSGASTRTATRSSAPTSARSW